MRLRRCALLVLPFCLLIAPSVHASARIDLDRDWHFRTDPREQGELLGWPKTMPAGTEAVRVPHTWNIGPHDDHEGLAWYFQTYALTPGLHGQHIELHFGATFYQSKVWLNGSLLGSHEGGHTEYWFDVSSLVKPGENYIAVELDNRPTTQSIPGVRVAKSGVWYDWFHYGGIVRDVWLSVTDGSMIRRQKIASTLTPDSANVVTSVFVENHHDKPSKIAVEAVAYAPDGPPAARASPATVTLAPGESRMVPLTLQIARPQLWGIDHPRLYQMTVELKSGGELLESKTDSFGLRSVEIRGRHFFLNGEQVRLTGLSRHEDSPWEGLAETAGTIQHDFDEMKQLHVTLSRPVHYPQNEQVLDYADQHGILLIPEIPVWQFSEAQLGDPKVIALAQQMMREMIEQDGNHPSIWAWSVCNESAIATVNGRAYVHLMRQWINQLDPGRYVSYASDSMSRAPDPGKEATADIDFIMLNAYWGTFHGTEESMVPSLDKIGRDYPDKMVIVSEFGAPGEFAGNSIDGDKLRIHVMETDMSEFAKRDWIGGAIFWSYADYKSHHGIWPGATEGYDDIGLEDQNRQRRPSYYAWQKINEPVTMDLHWKKDFGHNPIGFEAAIARKPLTSLPSYPLKNYTAEWELRDRDGALLGHGEQLYPDLETAQVLQADWAVKGGFVHDTLTLKIVDPQGLIAGEASIDAVNGLFGGEPVRGTP